MMIPQMLTPELSRSHSSARARARSPMAVLCLSGLLFSAVACSGSIDEHQEAASNGPATTANGRGNVPANAPSPAGTSGGTASAAGDTSPSDINARERDTDDILGVSGASRAGGGGRRGGGSRANDIEDRSDAGDADAGEADAGAADAGDVDAGLEDGGLGDAGAAPL